MKDNLQDEKKEERVSVLKWTDYASSAWPKIRDTLLKAALMKWIPRLVTGPWGWIISPLISWGVDHVVKPIYNFTVRKIIVFWRKQENNKKGEDVQNSKTEGEFNSTFDDLP